MDKLTPYFRRDIGGCWHYHDDDCNCDKEVQVITTDSSK